MRSVRERVGGEGGGIAVMVVDFLRGMVEVWRDDYVERKSVEGGKTIPAS